VEHFEVENGRVTPGVEEVLAQAKISSETTLLGTSCSNLSFWGVGLTHRRGNLEPREVGF